MNKRTTINIDKEVREALKGCRRYKRETYDETLKGLIKSKISNPISYKQGCKGSLSGEHSFETYGMPKGKMKCVHCGKIKSIKKAR